MKCWFVSLYGDCAYDDDGGDFVFASNRYQARRIGWEGCLLSADHWMQVRAVRVPALDGTPRRVTSKEIVNVGGYYGFCDGCEENKVDQYSAWPSPWDSDQVLCEECHAGLCWLPYSRHGAPALLLYRMMGNNPLPTRPDLCIAGASSSISLELAARLGLAVDVIERDATIRSAQASLALSGVEVSRQVAAEPLPELGNGENHG